MSRKLKVLGKMSSNAKNNSSKKRDDHALFDLEQQFILRLPPGPAIALRRDVQSGQMNLKEKLSVELHNDNKHATVCYGGQMLSAKLVDLPSIIESLKTTDKKTFYKTADISQMMVCSSERDFLVEDEDEHTKKKDKRFQCSHGITPPLKNVRKRRFRRTLKKKVIDMSDIEKEVKRLFRTDNEAIDVKWELVTEDSKPVSDSGSQTAVKVTEASATSLAIAEHIFGELSSSEEEDDKDVNIMDSGDEESRLITQASQNILISEDTVHSITDMDTSAEPDNIQTDFQSKLFELEAHLEELNKKKKGQQAEIDATENVALKQRFQVIQDSIIEEIATKQREYEILASMVNQS